MIKDSSGNRRFYGIYRGVVTDTNDPLRKGRVRGQIPQVLLKETSGWMWSVHPLVKIIPAAPHEDLGSDIKVTIPRTPEVGENIWVMFEGGDPSYPVILGTF